MAVREEFFTISELNKFIKDVINAGFPQILWICGEIQGYDRNKDKKHVFFELVEKDPQSKDVLARIGLVIFAGKKTYIENILKESENAFSLKDDIEVKLACRVDFYVPQGAVRLIVETIDPVYTLGKLAQERQKLIALLKKEGVLDKNKQLPLSLVPLSIGLITSDDSAAFNDFLSELKRSGFGFKVYLRNTLMQGKKAEKDVCQALKELSMIKDLDVVVITRGGGSIADLSCFDSKIIAEAIAGYRLAVLSGIGHEINITITDLAAHTFAKTPTAIAQFLVHRVKEFVDTIDEKMDRIMDGARSRIDSEKQRLKDLASGLQGRTNRYLKDHHEKMIRITEIIRHRPFVVFNASEKILIGNKDLLIRVVKSRFQADQLKLKGYQKIIDVVHPYNTMRRGFSITRTSDGNVVKSISHVHAQEGLVTELMDGVLESELREIKKAEGPALKQ
ncbi:MAG: exodeoxyribonuclease VII large subunit [Omnitrophica WOR_2 bacterium GWA2_45_18]|nr:MAG: exodeoxyribonuclease VII large subunit [Omnitrophica WOR_2 bacterium GWA2_45_18]